MAQRFGGKYSPDADHTATGNDPAALPRPEVKTPGNWRFTVLFLTAFAFLFSAFRDGPREMLLGLAAGGLLILSAWLTREGARAAAAYDARKAARRPAFPRKLAGALLTGTALLLGSLIGDAGLIFSLIFGLVGGGLHLLSFGLDPMADKGMEGIDAFQTERVARAVDEGEKYLAGMKDAIVRANDLYLEGRVDRFTSAARALFRRVEEDPGDLTAARKYLTVYLMGARDATSAFADVYASTRDAKAKSDYEALLTDLETNFASRTTELLSSNRMDLEVEISVLRDRLKLEQKSDVQL